MSATSTSTETQCPEFEGATDTERHLLSEAFNARQRAHCPYSKFHVGSAVLTEDGSVYAGCNVENASYGLTVCAERVAIMNAVVNGHKRFQAIAISCDTDDTYTSSCGACRQVLAEFSMDWKVYQVLPNGRWRKVDFRPWLPEAFTPASLDLDRI